MYKRWEENENDKAYRQECYGFYCNKCRQLNVTPVKYCNFSVGLWDIVKIQK